MKTRETRFKDTVKLIGQKPNSKKVVKALDDWYDNTTPWERKRVLDALSFGQSILFRSNSSTREVRRAIGLIRCALLRHEPSKVKGEVSVGSITFSSWGDDPKALDSKLTEVINLANMGELVPPEVEFRRSSDRNDITKKRSGVRVLYVPDAWKKGRDASNDPLQYASSLAVEVAGGNLSNNGDKKLNQLDNGGELFIFGHGNWGKGIGTHFRYYDEYALVKLLLAEGLSKAPTAPIWVYLWSCSTAVHIRRNEGDLATLLESGKRTPFLRRFAAAMNGAGLSNHYVVGFAGVSNYGGKIARTTDDFSGKMEDEDGYALYEVKKGTYNRIHGYDWTTKLNRKSEKNGLGELEEKVTFETKKRGGKHNETSEEK